MSNYLNNYRCIESAIEQLFKAVAVTRGIEYLQNLDNTFYIFSIRDTRLEFVLTLYRKIFNMKISPQMWDMVVRCKETESGENL
jgi:hypothetical protein